MLPIAGQATAEVAIPVVGHERQEPEEFRVHVVDRAQRFVTAAVADHDGVAAVGPTLSRRGPAEGPSPKDSTRKGR